MSRLADKLDILEKQLAEQNKLLRTNLEESNMALALLHLARQKLEEDPELAEQMLQSIGDGNATAP